MSKLAALVLAGSFGATSLAGCAARASQYSTPTGVSPAELAEIEWNRVQGLDERTLIFVAVEGSPEVKRWSVSASESTLVVRDTRVRAQPYEIPRADVVQVRAPLP